MFRTALGSIVALGLSMTAALAEPIFDGTVTFSSATNNCGVAGASYQAIYRPQIGSTARNSGLVIFQYRSGVGLERVTDGQFNGSGTFAGVRLNSSAFATEIAGTFTATQTPALVGTGTQTIVLSGAFTPTTGCRFVFKSVFLRRAGT